MKMKKILGLFLFLNLLTLALLSVQAESVDLSGVFSASGATRVSLTNDDVKLANGICVNQNTNQRVNGIVSVYKVGTGGLPSLIFRK